jgi:class 3 adenylate cyclase
MRMAKAAFTPGSSWRTKAAAGPPATRYTKGRRAHLAYQVAGEGPPHLVAVLGTVSGSIAWEEWAAAPFFHRLSNFCQLVTFDQQGSGRSDPVESSSPPTLEERVDDLRSVMDAAGIERAALFGTHDGGAVSMMFAATHPERVSALVLANTWARLLEDDDFPVGFPRELLETGTDRHSGSWGAGSSIDYLAPSVANNPEVRDAWARHEQSSASPGQAVAISRMAIEIDVRESLAAISAPTLVMHATEDLVTPLGHGRYLAEHIAGARLVEFASRDHLILIGEGNVILDEVEEFLTGVRRGPYRERVLATLVFTDVVGSTETADHLGDRSWRELISRHHAAVRRELARHEGTEIDRAGDGFLAMFDGPGRAIQCALAILAAVEPLGLQLRVGVHTGECELLDDGIAGIAVHIGARVASHAEPGEVLVSSTVKDLVVGSGICFTDRGSRPLKGVPGEWSLYGVERFSG